MGLLASASVVLPKTSLAWIGTRSRRQPTRISVTSTSYSSTANLTTYNFTVNLSAPSPGRKIIVCSYGLKNATNTTTTGMTLGGVAGTLLYNNPVSSPGFGFFLWDNDTTTGSVTVAVTSDQLMDRMGITVFEVYNWDGQYNAQLSVYGSGVRSVSWNDVRKNSAVLAVAYSATNTSFNAWSGATQLFNSALEASDQASAAVGTNLPYASTYTVSVSNTSGFTIAALLLKSV